MMKSPFALCLFFAALLAAPPALAVEAKQAPEDETLPRPAAEQDADYYTSLAKVQAAYGLFEQAERLQLKAIEVERDPAAKERLSFELYNNIYFRAKWWDKAADAIRRTLSYVDKDDVRTQRKYRMDLARALKEAGLNTAYFVELEAIARLSRTDEEKERALRKLFFELDQLGRLQEKIDEYEALVEENPKDAVTLRLLAEIYYGNGLEDLPGKAIEKYEQIRSFEPDDLNACERLARLYIVAAKPDRALEMYEHLMKIDPDRLKVHFLDGVAMLLEAKQHEETLAWAERVAAAHPDQPAPLLRAAELYGQVGNAAKAAVCYQKAIPLFDAYTDQLSVYFRLIESQMAAEQYAGAEESCREALELDIRSESLRKRLRSLLNRALTAQDKPEE